MSSHEETTTEILTIDAEFTARLATIVVLGRPEALEGESAADVRSLVVGRARSVAASMQQEVRLRMKYVATGEIRSVLINPDGGIRGDVTPEAIAPISTSTAAPTQPEEAVPAGQAALELTAESDSPEEASERASFVSTEAAVTPATQGVRGAIARTTGWNVRPSAHELTVREWEADASRQFFGTRTIAIVNGRGGVGKTTTTACLSAAFGRLVSVGVLAWDNNDTRGSLGWRTAQGPHDATVQDFVPQTRQLLESPFGRAQLEPFVHRQPGDKYDVLRSNPKLLSAAQRIDEEEFDLVHAVAAKYYGLILIDSGNDESAPRWLRMIDHSTQLVIPTSTRPESAESAALLLEELRERDEKSRLLADNAVIIVTHAERTASVATADKILDGFRGLAAAAVRIPYDPALSDGRIQFDALARPTREAWTRAAAAIARGF
jgi:MinD-like ATPase involved in chromosome partitioning or flagellar assembly